MSQPGGTGLELGGPRVDTVFHGLMCTCARAYSLMNPPPPLIYREDLRTAMAISRVEPRFLFLRTILLCREPGVCGDMADSSTR